METALCTSIVYVKRKDGAPDIPLSGPAFSDSEMSLDATVPWACRQIALESQCWTSGLDRLLSRWTLGFKPQHLLAVLELLLAVERREPRRNLLDVRYRASFDGGCVPTLRP